MTKTIKAKDFDYLLGTLQFISDKMLQQHFELYKGYIKALNEINTTQKSIADLYGNPSFSSYRSIASSKSFPYNAIIFHEKYFENINPKKTTPSELLQKQINENFGSIEKYLDDLKLAAQSARCGWVITGHSPRDGSINNYICDLHDIHSTTYIKPLLVLDVWEHAYTLDYGIKKIDYINAFTDNIDWDIVSKRLVVDTDL